MIRHRRAIPVQPGYFEVIARDGKRRYTCVVDEFYDITCDCPAGQHGRPCYHQAVTARRLLRQMHGGRA